MIARLLDFGLLSRRTERIAAAGGQIAQWTAARLIARLPYRAFEMSPATLRGYLRAMAGPLVADHLDAALRQYDLGSGDRLSVAQAAVDKLIDAGLTAASTACKRRASAA